MVRIRSRILSALLSDETDRVHSPSRALETNEEMYFSEEEEYQRTPGALKSAATGLGPAWSAVASSASISGKNSDWGMVDETD